jgi:hypothetical protein
VKEPSVWDWNAECRVPNAEWDVGMEQNATKCNTFRSAEWRRYSMARFGTIWHGFEGLAGAGLDRTGQN